MAVGSATQRMVASLFLSHVWVAHVHSSVKLWNSLPVELRSVYSLNIFGFKVKIRLYREFNVKFIPKLYSFTPLGKAPVHHCRLRLGLSALYFHRFTYNFIDINTCPRCNAPSENTTHFILHCPAYAAPSAAMMRNLSNHLPDNILNQPILLES